MSLQDAKADTEHFDGTTTNRTTTGRTPVARERLHEQLHPERKRGKMASVCTTEQRARVR
jgi:hypothetical protein